MQKEKKRKGGFFFWLLIIILLGIIAVSGYQVAKILLEYRAGAQQYNEVAETAAVQKSEEDITVDWKKLMAKYDNIKAWIYSKDTVINYPIVQGEDNSYYLSHMVNGDVNGSGSLFLDCNCEKPFEQFVSVVYGHRMKDGSMFHSLIEYRDHVYYEKHPKMLLVTPDKMYDIIVFAAVTIPSDDELYAMDQRGDAEKQAYIDRIMEKTELHTNIGVSTQDKLIMMSTCTYEFEDARLVVFGKLVEKEKKKQ